MADFLRKPGPNPNTPKHFQELFTKNLPQCAMVSPEAALPFDCGELDAAVCMESLEHLSNPLRGVVIPCGAEGHRNTYSHHINAFTSNALSGLAEVRSSRAANTLLLSTTRPEKKR